MIARLVLLLLMVLAAPAAVAMPACHGLERVRTSPECPRQPLMAASTGCRLLPAMAMPGHDRETPGGRRMTLGDAMCIGCVAPATLSVASLATPIPAPASPPAAAPAATLSPTALAPVPPPPRLG